MMFLLLFIFSNLDLQSPIPSVIGSLLHVLSLSAGNPTFIISCVVLALIAFKTRAPNQRLFILYMQFALILGLSFVLKSTVKYITEVPRPFTHQLVEQQLIDTPAQFYQLSEQQKNELINTASEQVPRYRIANWDGEKNYSFPSGHTIFVATCVVFWGGLFLREKRYLLSAVVLTWATGVAFSRYWLGMHWPVDILMSIFCAILLMLLVPDVEYED
ncbi:phosphatidylglycerophosphatase B [Psychromonas marina]|uniref:undecaprenyl-diphosphate phosphatase n=1 Tax=Psychromonas marina TaxID=88364 RepID=A0ABQ6E4B1_9GAMM|nr:phosphatidylglycerophosphatase B [Psychromonas marina]